MACKLRQIVCINGPVNSMDVCVKESDGNFIECEYSYSVDNVTWSDWLGKADAQKFVMSLNSEFFLRLRIYGQPVQVTIDNISVDYSVTLAPSFDFSATASTSLYNPYSNLDCAMKLYQSLTETVSNIVGIPCWYFKVSPDANAKDVTFKEYCHLAVSSVKFIKIIVNEGSMPSSKPDLDDFGISWNTDWETEISKATFATAFGNMAQPMEGDLVYIPMQQRMWQVSSAYEEKKDGFMWNATTFRIFMRKYESQDLISAGDFEDQIASVVKNTYEDLFGDITTGSNTETLSSPVQATPKQNVYQIWEKDAYRKEIRTDQLFITQNQIYNKGLMIADNWYNGDINIIYQKRYCGTDGFISFIIENNGGTSHVIEWGKHKIIKNANKISFEDNTIEIDRGIWFVWLRWSQKLRICELGAAKHRLQDGIPEFKRRPQLYYIDFQNSQRTHCLYEDHMITSDKYEIIFSENSLDRFTCIKFMDAYFEPDGMIQQYPNNEHLLVNDTARQVLDSPGYPQYNNGYNK